MSSSTRTLARGNGKTISDDVGATDTSELGSNPEFSPSSSSDSDSDSDSDEEITASYLNSLLEKARQSAREKSKRQTSNPSPAQEEEVIKLGEEDPEDSLPPLDAGTLPPAYFEFGAARHEAPSSILDPDVERAKVASSSTVSPVPPPRAQNIVDGKKMTKKERKALKNKTTGPSWFDLPAPAEADLPRLHREVEALRLRNQLDPKRFYKKDEGEGKGIKGLPRHFAIGTILPSSTPFGTASGDNLARAHRKRTFVDELVDDAEAKRYAKKKFEELQSVRGAKGRNTLHKKNALRKPKW
ncbi:Fcf2 pre-rRNA processing-domain-containing protein [Hygrophoropsis aurantiaca]|uniref:Fcf2 pre-rRNA processing-domain-containing protein n=1 Tax=Hygrophoropsis aurantiaca TaxID=72124 RepID=A0ACB8AKF7_9AGAM|nr:Fcf2 pre-rRNA processing-domain-containing protein [Hygrophoropsis aurantiaca]